MASIYDNPAFSYSRVGEGDYFSSLRNRIKEEYEMGISRTEEDLALKGVASDYQYGEAKTGFRTQRRRLKEDYDTRKENINIELAKISQRTFQRYVKRGAHAPTQFGLQNIATRNARLEKDRQDYQANRQYDRSLFDLHTKESQFDWQTAYQEKLAEIEQTRKAQDIASGTTEALTGLNKRVTDWATANTTSALESGVFSQKVLTQTGEEVGLVEEELPEEFKFNPNISYGY